MGRLTVVDLDKHGFLAAEVSLGRGRVRLVRSAMGVMPGDTARGDTAAVGAWLSERLKEAGIGKSPVIVSVPRGEVSVKLLEVPGAGGLGPVELGEAVRLQMLRQPAAHGEELAIDYLPPMEGDGRVVTAAIPKPTLERIRETVSAAGLKLSGVRLRSSGARAVALREGELAESGERVLGVAWQPWGAEAFVGRNARLVFARGVDVERPRAGEDAEAAAERLAVEISRTIVSYRVSPDGGDIGRVVVLGDDGVARAAAKAIAETTGVPTGVTATDDEHYVGLSEAAEHLRGPLLPLLGLALLDAEKERCLDFVNPHRPPDTAARTRQLVLAGVFAVIVAGGAGWVFADKALRSMDPEIARLKEERGQLQRRYAGLLLEGARVGHAEAWLSARADVPGHLRAAVAQLPPAPEALLDQVSVTGRSAVVFAAGETVLDPAAYRGGAIVDARMTGRVRTRELASDLRARLLGLGLYEVVESRGQEVAGKFDLDLRSDASAPPLEVEETGETAGVDVGEGVTP
jgi:Tfp pilus assembly PilM family ATPase